MKYLKTAIFVTGVQIFDPHTGIEHTISIYKHEDGVMFGIDSDYLDDTFGDSYGSSVIADPFGNVDKNLSHVMLSNK